MSRFVPQVSSDHFRNLTSSDRAKSYLDAGWWENRTLAQVIAEHAANRGDSVAFYGDHGATTWSAYDALSTALAKVLVAAGIKPGDRMAVWLPDSATVHIAFVAAEKAGITIVGIGARAGEGELRYLLGKTGATSLLTLDRHRDQDMADLVATLRSEGVELGTHIVVPMFDADPDAPMLVNGEPFDSTGILLDPADAMGPDDLFMLNSTSGTTGMPKCVMHNQHRWFYFHQKAAQHADLTGDDVFFGAVPAPFGFGLWTAHFTPAILGAPCVVRERFSADETIQLIERHGVTMLGAVSTQFIMMLNSPEMGIRSLETLRVIFTGGEAVPTNRARAFEEQTGATVLQFFGSNETGLLTGTTLRDSFEQRVTTAGRVVPEMNVRLFDGPKDVTPGGTGQPGGRGPALCLGYLDDDAANDQLFTADGWMLMGDIVTIDADGYLTVTGRTSDIIIRGGKNISAVKVESEVSTHPSVALAAAVAAPDDVFGERVCVFVELKSGHSLGLDELQAYLLGSGTSKSDLPEHLVVLDQLPRASGGKVAKGQLKAGVTRYLTAVSG
ncbi:MAG: class I adenylate-forming enzyme family protein [Actinomycetota bacterium]